MACRKDATETWLHQNGFCVIFLSCSLRIKRVPAAIFASQTLVVNTVRECCGLWISELHKVHTANNVHQISDILIWFHI